jgi:uncharacterized 2Fe-2S/4Fe-4S cluster protein (DUF4445 family)
MTKAMKQERIKVVFQPWGRTVHVLPGSILLEAAARAGVVLETPCGGGGTCGKCKVKILEGAESCRGEESNVITSEMLEEGYRLACEVEINEELVVEIPEASTFEGTAKILVADTSDGPVVTDRRFEGNALGVAIDLGTTTIVATLLDLSNGEELSVVSDLNPQVSCGDDVISRIQKVREDAGALLELKKLVIDAANGMIDQLVKDAGLAVADIKDITVAGNSTMQQIFCGIDVSPLGEVPFKQAFHEGQTFAAEDLGLNAGEEAQVYVFPQIGGFVGGDTVAGMVSSRLDRRDGSMLLVDVGTNGEIALSHNGKLVAASTAAGPAFEGARISQGMRAMSGAIEKVVIGDDVALSVIGDVAPVGLCGTALIDSAAWLLRLGIIEETGRMLLRDEVSSEVPSAIRDRVSAEGDEIGFVLAEAKETASGEPIILRQKDVREMQLAVGAVRAGINILMKQLGVDRDGIDRVMLAGGFGNFIRRSNACRIGLLPDIPHNRISFIGNASSLGAKLALSSLAERAYAERLREKTEHVDLSHDPAFQMEFAEAMMFPSSEGR